MEAVQTTYLGRRGAPAPAGSRWEAHRAPAGGPDSAKQKPAPFLFFPLDSRNRNLVTVAAHTQQTIPQLCHMMVIVEQFMNHMNQSMDIKQNGSTFQMLHMSYLTSVAATHTHTQRPSDKELYISEPGR